MMQTKAAYKQPLTVPSFIITEDKVNVCIGFFIFLFFVHDCITCICISAPVLFNTHRHQEVWTGMVVSHEKDAGN